MIIASLLAGCASLTRQAQDALLAELPSPYGTSFSDLRSYPGEVVCGRYTATDLEGLRSRTDDFIYTDGNVYLRPSAQQKALFCTTEPAAALERELGMEPWEDGNGALGTIRADLHALSEAIAAHAAAKGDAPFQGLEELTPPAATFLPALPTDPWGNAYHYELGLGGRSQRDYRLYTLGADNRPGGTGADADVTREHLPYLDRLARL
jgi:hypothetical protein